MDYKITSFDLKLALLQYFRFRRQWICVDEFEGGDVVADTGKEIIEVEVKISKSDLINGERAKIRKHLAYEAGCGYGYLRPNKFLLCVPEKLAEVALEWTARINKNYGVIGFDTDSFNRRIAINAFLKHADCLRIVKSAKQLHKNYGDKLRWNIARRASSKLATLMEERFHEKDHFYRNQYAEKYFKDKEQ